MLKFNLVNYFDVWGNKKDGWEINNLCNEGIIEVKDCNHKTLIKTLKDFGFFKAHVRENMLHIWDDGEMIEFNQKRDGKPVCRLELIQD